MPQAFGPYVLIPTDYNSLNPAGRQIKLPQPTNLLVLEPENSDIFVHKHSDPEPETAAHPQTPRNAKLQSPSPEPTSATKLLQQTPD